MAKRTSKTINGEKTTIVSDDRGNRLARLGLVSNAHYYTFIQTLTFAEFEEFGGLTSFNKNGKGTILGVNEDNSTIVIGWNN